MVFGMISPYIITTLFAWLAAHAIKFVISVVNKEKRNLRAHLFISGGMPSSHSAAVVSMATVVGLRDGIGTGLFGVASLFALIVMYDAMKVRRSSGEQGVAIQQMLKEAKSKIKPPRVALGHTPFEVSIGALLGLSVGIIVFFATK
jgi:acid phosphatase family membrane protein YuiD